MILFFSSNVFFSLYGMTLTQLLNNYLAPCKPYCLLELPVALNASFFSFVSVSLILKYSDSKLPADGMKTKMQVQVIQLDGVYRVIAVEDPQNE